MYNIAVVWKSTVVNLVVPGALVPLNKYQCFNAEKNHIILFKSSSFNDAAEDLRLQTGDDGQYDFSNVTGQQLVIIASTILSSHDQRGSEVVRNKAEMEELSMKTFIIS